MHVFRPVLAMLVLAAAAGCPTPSVEPDPTPVPSAFWLPADGAPEPVRAAWFGSEGLVEAPDSGGLTREGEALAAAGLPEGTVIWLGGDDDVLLAYVHGAGLVRSVDEGASFVAPTDPPALPSSLGALLNPRGRAVPFGASRSDSGALWLATIGGLFRSTDAGDTWASTPVASSGSLNVLFTGVTTSGDDVWAVSQLADSMLPASFSGLLSGTVFHSADGGVTWEDASAGLRAVAPTSVVMWNGSPALDPWTPAWSASTTAPGSSRGQRWTWSPWRCTTGRCTPPPPRRGCRRCSPMPGSGRGPVRWWRSMAPARSGRDGARYVYGVGAPPRVEDVRPGVVSVALSFHVNLYHSYRGDTPDDEGYGQDLRVLTRILEWLDEHPAAKADWDIENQFSLDGWLLTEGPEIRSTIAQRVADGRDDVRVMSWNNGAVASETEVEFTASIVRAQESYDAVFASQVPGVQPQENMFTPEHIGWYRSLGIDWITLFNSATGFTGLRSFHDLDGAALHNPVTLRDPDSGDTMVWVPVYHHADVLDHGGLASWVRQLQRSTSGDVLLAVHFDGDAESWENFDRELIALQPLIDSGVARYSTIQEYLDNHEPVASLDVLGDVADGTGDGFQSWAEKDFNHRLFTQIVTAREWTDRAALLGAGDAAVQAALDAALTPRLIALSTTHFGLAAPYLVPDRVDAAWKDADEALALAQTAWELAENAAPVTPGTLQVLNPRDSAGPALVEFRLSVPSGAFTTVDAIAFYRDGVEIPARLTAVPPGDGTEEFDVQLVTDVAAAGTLELTYAVDATGPRATGALTAPTHRPTSRCRLRSPSATESIIRESSCRWMHRRWTRVGCACACAPPTD